MTANLLTQGTGKRSAKDIAEAIDFVGGSLNAASGKDATTVTLDVVKKDLNLGLDLMSDVVLHPAFSADELERQRQQLLSSLTVQYSDPEYLASVVFSRVVYGGSPYGLPGEGTPETVKKLNRDDLAKFHDANYAPNQSLLAFAGDVTPEEAFGAAEKYFGGWQKQDIAAAVPASPSTLSGQHIWLIDKPDAVQTQIRVGKLGIRRNDPDYIPVEVTNRIFGGGYNSLLNTEVRVKKGLTYGAYSQFSPQRYSGAFLVGTFTRTDKHRGSHEAGRGFALANVLGRSHSGAIEICARLPGRCLSDPVGNGRAGVGTRAYGSGVSIFRRITTALIRTRFAASLSIRRMRWPRSTSRRPTSTSCWQATSRRFATR